MHVQTRRLMFSVLLLCLLVVQTPSLLSDDGSDPLFQDPRYTDEFTLPPWNEDWSHCQELHLPINTENPAARFQPIDMEIVFDDSCWAKNTQEHSIRVLCWYGNKWHELESQIYDLNYTDEAHISSCSIVFLIPDRAYGDELYYVYYDDHEKPGPNYPDHVSIIDSYYYYEPISGISVEGDYYKITEDGYVVYGIGQKGNVMNRKLSQIVIKQQPQSTTFDILNSDLLASFSFAYQEGTEETDEVSSDQVLISKEIIQDGNLMVEFGIISESTNGNLRTTNVYKYYYSPTTTKRMNVHVKHEVLKECIVKGIENVDGRYGAIISYRSRSAGFQKMCFGDILPYLHVYGENNRIKEYQMDTQPENKEREWIISYLDDCDLGDEAWISYDEGDNGKVHAVLFSNNKNVVTHGTDERDGIEVKVAEREYLNAIGTDIDYASIAFGRNSYEAGRAHDLVIPDDLVVEFDAEFFTIEQGSYADVHTEGGFFRKLASYRYKGEDEFTGNQNIYTLTIIPHLGGRIISYPLLVRLFNLTLPVTWIELYQNDTLIQAGMVTKPIVGFQIKKFPKLAPGEYVVKIYTVIGDRRKNYIGIERINLQEDLTLHIYTLFQKTFKIMVKDQNGQYIKDVDLFIFRNNTLVTSNTTSGWQTTNLYAPFNLFKPYVLGNLKDLQFADLFTLADPYVLKAYYQGFLLYDEELGMLQKNVDITQELYDLTVTVEDRLGFAPGVNVHPSLTSSEMRQQIDILPKEKGQGVYLFENLPPATYELKISYGGFTDTKIIDVPAVGQSTDLKFTATYDLAIDLLNSQGGFLLMNNQKVMISRQGKVIHSSLPPGSTTSLPPGEYTVTAVDDTEVMGSKIVDLANDKNVQLITKVDSMIALLVTGLAFIFIGQLVVLFIAKKISLNTCLKATAMALIVVSLFQPWWALSAASSSQATKESMMYLYPQTMIDTLSFEGKVSYDIATLPEMFTNFVGILVIIICAGLVFMGMSFIPNIVLRRRFSLGLVGASLLFIILVAAAFSLGMSHICEISLGGLQGQGMLDIELPTGETVDMSASWGLSFGFYLCILSALLLIATGVIDFLRKKGFIGR
jgi:hypothetical protein